MFQAVFNKMYVLPNLGLLMKHLNPAVIMGLFFSELVLSSVFAWLDKIVQEHWEWVLLASK